MEPELHARVKNLAYKVRASSKESQAQKAVQVLDPDLRTHWSTSTNSKEWLLLELEEPCLLSHIRIHNKSVLEWEISIGLRFKPDTFLKVRPRCEAPRRDITYHIGYLPCRFVRISCLRGNPIAIFHIQLIGVPVPGLEPEFQPIVEHLLPHITVHIRDPQDLYLQLLQDIALKLGVFVAQLEGELSAGHETLDSVLRFLAMLAANFYPIMAVVGRENEKILGASDADMFKSNQASVFTVSSNFQAPPKRIRSPGQAQQPAGHTLAFRPDVAILLLKVASKDSSLSMVCQKVARLLSKLAGPAILSDGGSVGDHVPVSLGQTGTGQASAGAEELIPGTEPTLASILATDYSSILGEEFKILGDDGLEIGHVGLLEIPAVEEGFLHLLYACASQPILSRRLADSRSDLVSVLPFIQAILPAFRPNASATDLVDESFTQWQAPLVQRALSQGPLAPWLPMVIGKVDLAIEVLEDLLGVVQAGQTPQAKAALVYLMLGLSGHMDNMLTQYKDVKHRLLFLVEMLEPYLIPAIMPLKNTIAFGDVSTVLLDKQVQGCAMALDLLRTAIKKPGVLSAMEGEWRQGHAVPSVLLSILAPHDPLPPSIDLRKSTVVKGTGIDSPSINGNANDPVVSNSFSLFAKPSVTDDEKVEVVNDANTRDVIEDGNKLFAPSELKGLSLPSLAGHFEAAAADNQIGQQLVSKGTDGKESNEDERFFLDVLDAEDFFDLQTEYLQLVSTPDRELRALEFIRFATELHSRSDNHDESHEAAIDALLLAAECHLNPFFMLKPGDQHQLMMKHTTQDSLKHVVQASSHTLREGPISGLVSWLEEERDKSVLHIILRAAEWDSPVPRNASVAADDTDAYGDDVQLLDLFNRVCVSEEDASARDAVTVVRQHQTLLCQFLVHQLQRERHNMYEVLLHGLLFVLESATELATPPTDIIEVILQTAERLNSALLVYHNDVYNGTGPQESFKAHGIRRQWALLRRLVLVSSGGPSGDDHASSNDVRDMFVHKELVPAAAWLAKIPDFAISSRPLVRYVGWMAMSRFAKCSYITGFSLITDLAELSRLLLIFSDELVSVEGLQKVEDEELHMGILIKAAGSSVQSHAHPAVQEPDQVDRSGLVKVLYPELDAVFPNLKSQFRAFAESILNSVCLQLKVVPHTAVPNILTWFSGFCRDPFALSNAPNSKIGIKGFALVNTRYVILRLLEVIIAEHIDVVVPELPRVIEVVLALSSSSFCDVDLLRSLMTALKPVISHSTATAAAFEFHGDSHVPSVTFEKLCFETLLEHLKLGPVSQDQDDRVRPRKALLLFLAGYILSDLSMGWRNDLLSYLLNWTDFSAQDTTESLHVYLCSFFKILEECKTILESMSTVGAAMPQGPGETGESEAIVDVMDHSKANTPSSTSSTALNSGEYDEHVRRVDYLEAEPASSDENEPHASFEDAERETKKLVYDRDRTDLYKRGRTSDVRLETEFRSKIQKLVMTLAPSLEAAWKLHPQLAAKVSRLGASCLLYSSVLQAGTDSDVIRTESGLKTNASGQVEPSHAVDPQAFVQEIIHLQQLHCWQVAGVAVDNFLSAPSSGYVGEAFPIFCKVLYHQCSHAPRIAWRLWTSKWLSKALLLSQQTDYEATAMPLIHLLCTMLEHSEPEQRSSALQQLSILVDDGLVEELSLSHDSVVYTDRMQDETEKCTKEDFTRLLVASTWSTVSSAAASDPLLWLRKQAMEVLLKLIPLAQSSQLRSLLSSINGILPPFTHAGQIFSSGPLTRLALSVFAKACLYSSAGDLDAVPHRVWSSIRALAQAKPEGVFMESERAVCRALLLLLQEQEDSAKQSIRQALSGDTRTDEIVAEYAPVREAVLEVLSRLNRARLKVDARTAASMQEAMDLEEAEIELEIAKEEQTLAHSCHHAYSTSAASASVLPSGSKQQLMELRSQIVSLDKSAIRAEISARRERQRFLRHQRQVAAEEAKVRELQLLQQLESERAAQAEKEIERQRMLEREKAKTRELKYALEIEAERRNQRELQRDIEQRESSATRPSRREFPSTTPSSRPRERYRERDREGGRQEGSSRPSNGGGGGSSATTPPATPTAGGSSSAQTSTLSISTSALAAPPATAAAASVTSPNPAALSSKAYPGQTLHLLHARDRSEDRGFDEGLDGNGVRDDGSSFGESEGGLGIDLNNPNSLSSSQRPGPRSTRPRQVVERRERDSRREGKWERKQNKLDGLC